MSHSSLKKLLFCEITLNNNYNCSIVGAGRRIKIQSISNSQSGKAVLLSATSKATAF